MALNDESSAVVRGGFGTFFERVPLTVAAFGRFEAPTITRFLEDGVTPVSPAARYPYRKARDLETPRSTIWNITFSDASMAVPQISPSPCAKCGSPT